MSLPTASPLPDDPGTADYIDTLSLTGCISVPEVFRLNRKVVCYKHSLPFHNFRRLVLYAIFFWVLEAFCRSAWNGFVAIAVAMWKRRYKMLQYTYWVRNIRHLGSRAPNFLSHEVMHWNGRGWYCTRLSHASAGLTVYNKGHGRTWCRYAPCFRKGWDIIIDIQASTNLELSTERRKIKSIFLTAYW